MRLVSPTVAAGAFEQAGEPAERVRRLGHQRHEAFDTLHAVLRSPVVNAYEAQRACSDAFHATCREAGVLNDRIARLERELRDVLACDGVAAELRERVIAAMPSGRRNRLRDAKLLSEAEQALLGNYRALDPPARQMVRTLFDRLAQTSTSHHRTQTQETGDDQ